MLSICFKIISVPGALELVLLSNTPVQRNTNSEEHKFIINYL